MRQSPRSPSHKKLIELLVQKRLANGLTQLQLALMLGRPQSFVAKYELGERRIDVIEFIEIGEALQLDKCAAIELISAVLFVKP